MKQNKKKTFRGLDTKTNVARDTAKPLKEQPQHPPAQGWPQAWWCVDLKPGLGWAEGGESKLSTALRDAEALWSLGWCPLHRGKGQPGHPEPRQQMGHLGRPPSFRPWVMLSAKWRAQRPQGCLRESAVVSPASRGAGALKVQGPRTGSGTQAAQAERVGQAHLGKQRGPPHPSAQPRGSGAASPALRAPMLGRLWATQEGGEVHPRGLAFSVHGL